MKRSGGRREFGRQARRSIQAPTKWARRLDEHDPEPDKDRNDPEPHDQVTESRPQRVTQLQKQGIKRFKTIGLSEREIAEIMCLPSSTVHYYARSVPAPQVKDGEVDSAGPQPAINVPASNSSYAGNGELRLGAADTVSVRKDNVRDVTMKPEQYGGSASGYEAGAEQSIDVSMRNIVFEWPPQMVIDMVAGSRHNGFKNVEDYHNDLAERSTAIDEISRYVGPWKGSANEFIERAKPTFALLKDMQASLSERESKDSIRAVRTRWEVFKIVTNYIDFEGPERFLSAFQAHMNNSLRYLQAIDEYKKERLKQFMGQN